MHKLKEPWQMWWNYVDDVVKEHNSENISRSTNMTPNEAAKPTNQNDVKTNLEAIRKSNNPQEAIEKGDEVRVMIKKNWQSVSTRLDGQDLQADKEARVESRVLARRPT